jgi:hypothetical protein
MQFFRNLNQPETGDIRTIPGYENLSEQHKAVAHRVFLEAFETYQGKGIRIANLMAFEVVKQQISEGTLPDSVTNVPQAHVPQANLVDAKPTEATKDEHEAALMDMINRMLHGMIGELKNSDPEQATSAKIQTSNKDGKEAQRSK